MAQDKVDLLIIGAGLSGIGQACHMLRTCKDKSFAVIEARGSIGGTWDLFRYPGIRSDSDMFTFGYRFRPWKSARDIAPGPDILQYLNDTIDEYGLRDHIRLQSRITRLNWSSARKRWIATVEPADGAPYEIKAKFVSSCTGYYNYEGGYLPEWDGYDRYQGQIALPQSWPEDLDYAGKRVAVIGSGATAVTIVPTMAEKAAHVTMIQRSPTYILSRPGEDAFAKWVNRLLPWRAAWKLARVKNILLSMYIWRTAKKKPQGMRAFLRKMAVDALPDGFDVDTHFNPSYDPWDQRLCLIPDGDFYEAISSGRATVVTDHIDHFTENGIVTQNGTSIDADIVVPATGLRIQFLGGAEVSLDGEPIHPTEHMVYRGMMLSNVPNFVVIFGYSNASWTLKADLTADFVCRMINRAAAKGQEVVTPVLEGPADGDRPLVSLQSGYLERARDMLPKTSDTRPWMNYENYVADMMSIRHGKMEDGVLRFS
ncbi:flavin-containing monooxygenase [Aestuariivita boseongensis]|uniref:flavin-containing monooxygenase n=1 Tax=Aestuariivita boseongensis TaxID=1470562 RepID=UPI000682BCBA|nr:NAD(P)/FAD-dependent oxidoreductase [Aestuariivita boseongensis]